MLAAFLDAFGWLASLYAYFFAAIVWHYVFAFLRLGAGQRARETEFLLAVGYGIKPLHARSVANA